MILPLRTGPRVLLACSTRSETLRRPLRSACGCPADDSLGFRSLHRFERFDWRDRHDRLGRRDLTGGDPGHRGRGRVALGLGLTESRRLQCLLASAPPRPSTEPMSRARGAWSSLRRVLRASRRLRPRCAPLPVARRPACAAVWRALERRPGAAQGPRRDVVEFIPRQLERQDRLRCIRHDGRAPNRPRAPTCRTTRPALLPTSFSRRS